MNSIEPRVRSRHDERATSRGDVWRAALRGLATTPRTGHGRVRRHRDRGRCAARGRQGRHRQERRARHREQDLELGHAGRAGRRRRRRAGRASDACGTAGAGANAPASARRSGSSSVKRAPPPGRSVDAERATHQRCELGRDRQAEAGALHVLRDERPEDQLAARRAARPGPLSSTSTSATPRLGCDRDLDVAAGRRPAQRVRDAGCRRSAADGRRRRARRRVAGRARRAARPRPCARRRRARGSACVQSASRSTCSRFSEKRRASSFARSSRSPIRRCRRSASTSTTSSEACCSSGSSSRPSASSWTWPWIAVSGVRSSCEMRIRKLRSCSSASRSLRAIRSKPRREQAELVAALAAQLRRRTGRARCARSPPTAPARVA